MDAVSFFFFGLKGNIILSGNCFYSHFPKARLTYENPTEFQRTMEGFDKCWMSGNRTKHFRNNFYKRDE